MTRLPLRRRSAILVGLLQLRKVLKKVVEELKEKVESVLFIVKMNRFVDFNDPILDVADDVVSELNDIITVINQLKPFNKEFLSSKLQLQRLMHQLRKNIPLLL